MMLAIPCVSEASFFGLLAFAEDHVVRLDPWTILAKSREGDSIDGLIEATARVNFVKYWLYLVGREVTNADTSADVVIVLRWADAWKKIVRATKERGEREKETHWRRKPISLKTNQKPTWHGDVQLGLNHHPIRLIQHLLLAGALAAPE